MHNRRYSFIAAFALLLIAGSANANIIYGLNWALPGGEGGSVAGTIETDGTTGILSTANLVDWNLTITDGDGSFNLLGANSQGGIVGSSLVATATDLIFDFSGSGFLLMQSPSWGVGQNWFCVEVSGCSNQPQNSINVTTSDAATAFLAFQGRQSIASVTDGQVPLPGLLALLALGLGVMGMQRRRTAAKSAT
jgi:hypothetical protein